MKAPRLARMLLPLLLLATFCLARAQAYDAMVAESPDHPATWVVGATRSHQGLRWSAAKHMLFGTVTYSTADFADNTHPTEEDSFLLSFPTVRFDAATGRFIASGGTVVATLHHGLFGDEVELAPGVDLSIHRHHGVIFGKLLADRED